MSKIVPVSVKFLGAVLQGAIKDGTRYVALRPIVEGIGLAWQSQHAKIHADEVLSEVVTEIVMTSVGADGKSYRVKMTCIPEEYLQGWMFGIKPGKVRVSLREKVIHYKRQCYRVLHEAFVAAESNEQSIGIEYLHGYHELHKLADDLAVESSNKHFVHMNLNKLVNKTVGIASGQRTKLPPPLRSLTVVVQNLATLAMTGAKDHHDGYDRAKDALGQLGRALQVRPA